MKENPRSISAMTNRVIPALLFFVSHQLGALAAVITIYQTNYHVEMVTQTHTNTQVVTQWTTSTQPYEEPTTTTTSTLTTTTTMSNDKDVEVLTVHNSKRRLHVDTSDLLWSNEVAASAQSYADQYNCNGTLIHSHGQYGENLALGYNTTGAVDAWYAEVSLYDWNDPVFSEQTGHFTQIVWANSVYVGCGYLDCGDYYGQYTVCQYSGPGNYAGEFETNVKPLKS